MIAWISPVCQASDTLATRICSCHVPLMVRRSTPAAKRDDDAFPIRVKLAVPPEGLGTTLDAMHAWLGKNLPRGRWAVHSARTIGGDAMAVYFVSLGDAEQFLLAHQSAKLAVAPSAYPPKVSQPPQTQREDLKPRKRK